MSYTPYLIADYRVGQQEDREPWLLPQDAFKSLKNAYLLHGVINKRNGYAEWGRLVHHVEDEVAAVGNGGKTYGGTLAHYPVRLKDISITDGVETFTDPDGDGNLTGSAGGTGTINYSTGEWAVTFNAAVPGSTDILADYDCFPDLPVMGITHYVTTAGVYDLIGFTTKRMNVYDTVNGLFEEPLGNDVWTGGDDNFFLTENYLNKLYITNGVDRLKSWDGSTLADVLCDIDNDGINEVESCKQCLVYKSRLLLFGTTEDGTVHPQRVRWPKPGTTDFTNDGYVDAPTADWFICASFIGDDLVAFFEWSVWALKYTGDASMPYRWERIDDSDGAAAPLSFIGDGENLFAVGPTCIVKTDGLSVGCANKNIPEAVLEIAADKVGYCYTARLEEFRQLWFTYPAIGSSYPDHVLVFNYEDKGWSRYALPTHCLAFYPTQSGDPTFQDFLEKLFSEEERPFLDKTMQAGYPMTLAGSVDGYVYRLNYGGQDNGQAIPFEVLAGRWNPYIKEGVQARLGFIDFLVERDPNVKFSVDFYLDHEETPYKTAEVTCERPDKRVMENVWVRVPCGAVGEFHQIRLYHEAKDQTVRIHAIMPWFKRAGRLIV